MRITPLSVWAHKLSPEKIHEVTKLDVSMTHCHKSCVAAVTAYNVAIAHLLKHLGDREGAIMAATNYLLEHGDT